MENRSNNLMVGAVTLLLVFALAAFTIWLSGPGSRHRVEYDIFFKQSVEGLSKGSAVTFSGVPAGQVKEIALWLRDPQYVRVRIEVDTDIPILLGTTASISGVGFTGVSQIALDGAVAGAPPITDTGPAGKPVIPARLAGLGELLNSAPQLLQRISTLTERLTELADDRNQRSLAHILANIDTLTGNLARSSPQLDQTLAEARVAVRQAGNAAEQIGQLAGTTNNLLDHSGPPDGRRPAPDRGQRQPGDRLAATGDGGCPAGATIVQHPDDSAGQRAHQRSQAHRRIAVGDRRPARPAGRGRGRCAAAARLFAALMPRFRRMKPMRSAVALPLTLAIAALGLGGCISIGAKPPRSLLTLTADAAPVASATTQTVPIANTLTVIVPSVPQKLRTPRVPVQTGATAIAYVKDAQWVEAPAHLFQRLLVETIAAGGQRNVIESSEYVAGPGEILSGELLDFGVDADRLQVVIVYQAQRLQRGGSALLLRRFEAREPIATVTAPEVGAALNRAANHVAADVALWVAR